MALLKLFLFFVLQLQAVISGVTHYLYHRPGNDVILPCDSGSDTCSMMTWLYNRDSSRTITVARNGDVEKSSAQAPRLSLYSNCSLGINNITAEDAGRYSCRIGSSTHHDKDFYLNILTISASPSDTDPQRDGDITLKCSLFRFYNLDPCEQNSFHWVNERGIKLPNGRVRNSGYTCDSSLTVKHESGHNKRYTCQFVKENSVKIEAHYPPVFIEPTVPTASTEPTVPTASTDPRDPNHIKIFIMIGAVVGMLVLLAVIAAFFVNYRRRAKVTEDVQKPDQHHDESENNGTYATVDHNDENTCLHTKDEPDSGVTYATINYANKKASPKKQVKEEEEEVMYSTVKTQVKTKAESDPSSFYSNLS